MLRSLILLLVCMNLGVGAWWGLHAAPIQARLPVSDPGVATLTLLSESENRALPSSGSEEMVAPPDPLSATPVCLSIGPFATPADLRRAMNTLMPQVGRIQFREVAATSLRGYRVYLPASGSREQALKTARELASHGVTDYYVVTAGDQQNTVSLGIFHDLGNARKRHDEIAAFGYDATVEARTEQAQQWWVDVAAAEGFDWRRFLPDPALQSASAACP
ncbi:MAG TPA: SPOR domain-containing protein [Arenimonas sp.]|uniref:SPOR domain-containing protein n=1 Tax=Arenimonas sp. TaxID=1872635 RepID=UPI002C815B20|nr:SPOR domain-containing protein [Arenimonas sp.]HMB58199.1 SPOR domain-containing protein [Arenimonas sp.]